jgi:phage-related protein
MDGADSKQVVFIGSSRDDLRGFPEDVKYVMGVAIREAQRGGKGESTKPLKGFGGAGVLEVVDDYDGDTYRTVYTVRFPKVIYVLHAFQKKSKRGAQTPKPDIELIKSRMKLATTDYEERKKHLT